VKVRIVIVYDRSPNLLTPDWYVFKDVDWPFPFLPRSTDVLYLPRLEKRSSECVMEDLAMEFHPLAQQPYVELSCSTKALEHIADLLENFGWELVKQGAEQDIIGKETLAALQKEREKFK